jgi:AGCS family alanine or glycine:cation symporter
MWSAINDFLGAVDNFVWGVPLMVLILTGGLLLTVRLGVLQFRKLPLALKWMERGRRRG